MSSSTQSGARLSDYIKAWPQYLLPHYTLSNLMFKLTRSKSRWWKNFFISWFVKKYDVDMSEAIQEDTSSYACFNDFFTRALKPDARPVTLSEQQLICPVDGYVSQMGTIKDGKVFQAKGQDYTLSELLAGQNNWVDEFTDGEFATLYLSPNNYHRIHMPCAGQLTQMTYVPGPLFSVSPATARAIPRLFARNERVIAHFSTENGPMIMILVGAIFVGGIETTWYGAVTPPHGAKLMHVHYNSAAANTSEEEKLANVDAIQLKQAEEMGRFNMGSTVILLFPKNTITWNPLNSGEAIKMGQELAALL